MCSGIANTGSPVPNGGLDTEGYAYAAALLGTSLSWNGSTFTFGAAGTSDAVSSTTIALPAGNDSTVNLLAAAVNGISPIKPSSSPIPMAPARASRKA